MWRHGIQHNDGRIGEGAPRLPASASTAFPGRKASAAKSRADWPTPSVVGLRDSTPAVFQLSLFDKWATKKGLTTTQKLVGYFKEMAQMFVKSGYQRACLAGKFSTEIAATSEVFRDQLSTQMHTWQERIVEVLRQGQRNGDVRDDQTAEQLADAVLSLIQGSFVIALSTRNKRTPDIGGRHHRPHHRRTAHPCRITNPPGNEATVDDAPAAPIGMAGAGAQSPGGGAALT